MQNLNGTKEKPASFFLRFLKIFAVIFVGIPVALYLAVIVFGKLFF